VQCIRHGMSSIDRLTNPVLSTKSADAIWAPIGHSKHADDQKVVVCFGRVDRPVARVEVGNQLVARNLAAMPTEVARAVSLR
jgi:hypothetical protein